MPTGLPRRALRKPGECRHHPDHRDSGELLITSHLSGSACRAGGVTVAGKAWDNGAGISAWYSTDGRQSWREAVLGDDLGRFAWREFSVPLQPTQRGGLEVAVRARSRSGLEQPQKLTFNPSGYHDNRVQSLTLEVT